VFPTADECDKIEYLDARIPQLPEVKHGEGRSKGQSGRHGAPRQEEAVAEAEQADPGAAVLQGLRTVRGGLPHRHAAALR
jgi:hypothetical protein